MPTIFKVNKKKCISCGACITTCPGGLDWDEDGKSKVINSEKTAECGGENLCPYQAIERKE